MSETTVWWLESHSAVGLIALTRRNILPLSDRQTGGWTVTDEGVNHSCWSVLMLMAQRLTRRLIAVQLLFGGIQPIAFLGCTTFIINVNFGSVSDSRPPANSAAVSRTLQRVFHNPIRHSLSLSSRRIYHIDTTILIREDNPTMRIYLNMPRKSDFTRLFGICFYKTLNFPSSLSSLKTVVNVRNNFHVWFVPKTIITHADISVFKVKFKINQNKTITRRINIKFM